MTDAALQALKDSIAHWERMATGTAHPDETPTGYNCPLCQLFCIGLENNRCIGCPVYQKTGEKLCSDTPYDQARHAWHEHEIDSPQFKQAALAEVEFLKSLLPAICNRCGRQAVDDPPLVCPYCQSKVLLR